MSLEALVSIRQVLEVSLAGFKKGALVVLRLRRDYIQNKQAQSAFGVLD